MTSINTNTPSDQLSLWSGAQPQMPSVFSTGSPINQANITGQNKAVYDHLQAGNTLNLVQARDMGIGFLNSRIAELRGYSVQIYSRMIRVNGSACKEYSLTPFE